ncbi:glycosyltransferase family 1 protein [Clostridium sp. DJ247]|uniref:glycosyltransferase family 4 protein n=1 Tax=Clostridium sp. DJ247 TaxID=2726188 RepID=UPI001627C481|nr:glycosyltransferase family 1 protein [Clostridium sp. DJ247]MBC2579905.1 glycosyltransferase family 4 protein [Clostridium sp. DJ247]
MKIAIDARGVNWYKGTGIGTYTDKILRYMVSKHREHKYHIYWSGPDYDSYKHSNTKIIMTSNKHHKFFEQNYFPNNLAKENADIYHIPQNGIGISEKILCKTVVTIHDLIPYILPETVGKGYLSKFLDQIPKIINISSGILTVSECSKRDILKFFPIDESKIFVTPLAADEQYKPLDKIDSMNIVKKLYNITKPFILYIGGFSPRKNVKSLISAYSKIYKNIKQDYELVIIGATKEDGNSLKKLIVDMGIESKVKFTGFVTEELLPVFYNACDVFVYPSLYEGFGLPPLEAMSCGTPVITSNISSIPEVVGDGGILIDPFDVDELVSSLEKLLNHENERKSLSMKALQRASEFSWEKTALATVKAYERILYKE